MDSITPEEEETFFGMLGSYYVKFFEISQFDVEEFGKNNLTGIQHGEIRQRQIRNKLV